MAGYAARILVRFSLSTLLVGLGWSLLVAAPHASALAVDTPSSGTAPCPEAPASRAPSGEPAPLGTQSDEAYIFEGELVGELLCVLLESDIGFTFELMGDLQGFGPGDHVAVEGKPCHQCVSVCMTGYAILEVVDISGAAGVGGVAELPPLDMAASASEGSATGVSAPLAALIGLAGTAVLAAALRLAMKLKRST